MADGLLPGKQIATGADGVAAANIVDGAVTTAKLAALAVTTAKIAAGAVTTTELGNLAVTTAKIAADAVTAAEIAAGAVGTTELAALAVTTAKIAADAVTAAEIAAGAVGTTELAALAVTTAKIAALAVTDAELAAGAVTTAKLANNAVTPAKADLSQAWSFGSDVNVAGNLNVAGSRVTVAGETSAFADNYVVINAGYTGTSSQTAGHVFVLEASSTSQAVAGAGFVAGVASTSNPTVEVGSTTGFAAGNIVQIDGTTNGTNDGIFEVMGVLASPARVQLKGIGTTAATEDWSSTQLTTAAASGTIRKLSNIFVSKFSSSGWSVAGGSSAPLTYTPYVGIPRQETIAAQTITTDTALTDQLDYPPVSAAGVNVYLNGQFQKQGAGNKYTISGQTITWLAGTGTAADMATTDELVVCYFSQY